MSADPSQQGRTRVIATLLLLAMTATWGSTFFLIKDLVAHVPSADFLVVRFAIAALAMCLVFRRQVAALPRSAVRSSMVLGGLYGTAQILQTIGLEHTSASVSGFVTGAYVVLTPVLGALLLRDRLQVARLEEDGLDVIDLTMPGVKAAERAAATVDALRKFVRLVLSGNPTVLIPLYAVGPALLHITPLGQELRELTPALVSREAGHRFLGYLDGQRRRLVGEGPRRSRVPNRPELVDRHGYDTKYASHALRLGLQGLELVTSGRLTLPMRPDDLAPCLAVKRGEVSFTEALAFVFQSRDLELLGLARPDSEADRMRTLSDFWATYEIGGVALTEIAVWHWMYDHPDATPAALREATVRIARDVWKRHYARVLGDRPEGVALLGIYSHMIQNTLYLPDYPIGHLIAFQIEEHLKKVGNLGAEFERMASHGAVTPDLWMEHATGAPISAGPLLRATTAALKGAAK